MRLLLMLVFAVLAFGCSKKGKPCSENGECGDELTCDPYTKLCEYQCATDFDYRFCTEGSFECDKKNNVCFDPVVRKPLIEAEQTRLKAEALAEAQKQIEWVKIEGGSFMMSKFLHRVRVKTFMMSKSEVTVGQYRLCMAAGVCSAPDSGVFCNWDKSAREHWDSEHRDNSDRENHPINCVSWFQLNEFAKWIGGRLPTEAEWEYAARSRGKERTYPWGNAKPSCRYTVFKDLNAGCEKNRTWPVCSKPKGNTEQGLCDMAGNVAEWVEDEYVYPYNRIPTDGTAARCNGSHCVKDMNYQERALRGGHWEGQQYRDFYTVTRRFDYPTSNTKKHGGRVVRSIP